MVSHTGVITPLLLITVPALLSAINYAQYDAFKANPQTKKVVVKVEHIDLVLKNKTMFVTEFVETHGITLDQFAVSKFQRAP